MIYVYFYKSFFKQIYSYNFNICKLNNLKVIDDLYFHIWLKICPKRLLNHIQREHIVKQNLI